VTNRWGWVAIRSVAALRATVRSVVGVRQRKHRWVYVAVLCNVLFLTVVPALEPLGKVPLFIFPLTLVFVIQFFRPTLLLWLVLVASLLVRTILFLQLGAKDLPGAHEYVAWFWFVVWDLLPIGLLLWAHPRAIEKRGVMVSA